LAILPSWAMPLVASTGPADAATVVCRLQEEETMALVGLVITFVGFLIAVASLGLTASVTGRMGMVLIGMAVSLFGIMGVVNQAYLKDAIWKK
jgi:cytochrome c biogenesis protein CcdA